MSLDLCTKHYRAASHQHHRDTTTAEARVAAHAALRVVIEMELLYKNNYPRESYHDHLHRDCCHNHRHLGTIAGIYDSCCAVGSSISVKWVRTAVKYDTSGAAIFFEYLLFRFEYVAAGLIFSTTIVGNTGSALACARRAGSRLLSLLLHCCCW